MKLSASLAVMCVMLLVVGLLGAWSPVWAQARYDDEPPAERFAVGLGGFLVQGSNTTFRLDSKKLPIGTVIDLEDNLDVDANANVVRIDGFYRFSKKHRFNFGWFRINRSGQTTVAQPITVVDPETGQEITIMAGAGVQTKWDFDAITALYNYSFLNTWRYELFIGGGFNMRNLNVDLQGNFDVNDSTAAEEVDAKGLVPLPVVSFGGRWNFSRKWLARWDWQWLAIELGDFQGVVRDVAIVFENNTFKHIGFGFGLNSFSMNIEAEGDKLRGEFDSSYTGFLIYLKGYF